MAELEDIARKVRTKKDFIAFLKRLNSEGVENWENRDIVSYLDGLLGFTSDIDGFYANQGLTVNLENPTWSLFAEMLLAARVYE